MAFVNEVIAGFTSPEQTMIFFKIFLGALLGFIIGWNRRASVAGIRTFTLISIGATVFTIVSVSGFPGNATNADQARIVAQIVSGVGFIGVGVIWKHKGQLTGLTTAATIWIAASIGISVGVGMFSTAALVTGLTLLLLNLKPWLVKFQEDQS